MNVFVLIDLKGIDFECYCGVILFMLNMLEFEVVVGYCKDDDEIVVKGLKMIVDFDLLVLLVICFEKGMILFCLN